MNLGKVILFGVISGILSGGALTVLISIISLIPLLNLLTILIMPILWLILAIVTPAIVLYKIKSLGRGDGIGVGVVSGLFLSISFGILMIAASFIIASLNIYIQGRTEVSGIDALLVGFGILFYLVVGFLGAIPSAIAGAISGWYFEKRWTIEKVEVVKTKS